MSGLGEAIPLFPVYALLFADSGLSVGQISSLFVLWSAVGFVLEIPSGAWADRVSRRHLLGLGAALRAAGFALWVTAPSYPAFAAGFVLWGVCSALRSGTLEALLYDELAAAGAASEYGRVLGRGGVFTLLAEAAATLVAAPALRAGGFALVGWLSVAVCLADGALALSFPATAPARSADGGLRGYLATLRAGLAESRRAPAVRGAVIVLSLLGIMGFDEYVPLLARSSGIAAADVPVVLAAQVLAAAAASWLGGRYAGVAGGWIALAFAVAGAAVATAGLGVAGPLLAFCLGEFIDVVLGTRIQHTMSGTARATVLSVAGFGSEIAALAAFGVVGVGSTWLPTPVVLAFFGLPLVLVAAAAPRLLGRDH